MQTREPHRIGEHLTVSFPLPGDTEISTATGVIRWAADQPKSGGWYGLGMEWLPLEEDARSRLHRFFSGHAQGETAPRAQAQAVARGLPKSSQLILVVVLVVGVIVTWQTVRRLTRQTVVLGHVVEQRDAVIGFLKRQKQTLQTELTGTKQRLAETAQEAARLGEHARALGGEVARLGTALHQADVSFAEVSADRAALQAEREPLMQKMMDLEQERLVLARRLVNTHQVKLIVREMIAQREQAETAKARAARRLSDFSERGNEGFVIREGRATLGHGTVWIRVHEPEASSVPAAQQATLTPEAAPQRSAPQEAAVAAP